MAEVDRCLRCSRLRATRCSVAADADEDDGCKRSVGPLIINPLRSLLAPPRIGLAASLCECIRAAASKVKCSDTLWLRQKKLIRYALHFLN